jgi:hypothetical protein
MNGLYWGLTALHLLGRPDALPRDETIEFVLSCQHDNGGFGAAPRHDAHLLYTVSAVQILAEVDALDVLEKRGKGGQDKGGKRGVGNCTLASSPSPIVTLETLRRLTEKISPPFKPAKQAPFQVTNGAKKIHVSSTQH